MQFNFNDLDTFAKRGFPHELLTPLRREGAVHWHDGPDGDGFWLVLSHPAVIAASRDWRTFSSDNANGGITGLKASERHRRIDNLVENTFVTMDPPEHGKYRQAVTKAMLPAAIRRVEERVRRVSIDLIEAALEKDSCDFVKDIAAWIPLEALAELGNIPGADRNKLFDWVNALLGPDDPEYAPTFAHALEGRRELQAYCEKIYCERLETPGDDIISMMIRAEIDGERVSSRRAAAFFEILLAAGSETTRTTMSHGVLALARDPHSYAQMRANVQLARSSAVEEMLRWATPIHYFRRGVTVNTEFCGKQLKAGDSLVLCYASANRDETVFGEPFSFDIQRSPNPHVSFGGNGPHACLGSNLARLELRTLFEELCSRVARIELIGEPRYLRSNVVHGIKHLPVRLHRAPRGNV